MDHQLNGIDHVIIGVRDLEAARAQYARLGFNSTPRGRHVGWGTANYCIMFEHDYLELLGIVDPAQFTNQLDRFLEQREGILGMALASRDADATQRAWTQAGLQPEEAKALGRLLEGEGGAVELRFRNVGLPRSSTGGAQPVRLRASDPGADAAAGLARPSQRRAGDPLVHHRRHRSRPRSWRAMGRLFGSAAITAHRQGGGRAYRPRRDLSRRRRTPLLMHPLLGAAGARWPSPVPGRSDVGGGRSRAAADFLRLQGVAFARSPNGDVLVPPARRMASPWSSSARPDSISIGRHWPMGTAPGWPSSVSTHKTRDQIFGQTPAADRLVLRWPAGCLWRGVRWRGWPSFRTRSSRPWSGCFRHNSVREVSRRSAAGRARAGNGRRAERPPYSSAGMGRGG